MPGQDAQHGPTWTTPGGTQGLVLMWVTSVFVCGSQRALCKTGLALRSWGLALPPSALTWPLLRPDVRCPAHPPTHAHSHSLSRSVTLTHRVAGALTTLLRTPTGQQPLPGRASPAQPRVILTLEDDHAQAAVGS